MGRLNLHRVNALYAAWERTPPVAVMVAAYLGYESKKSKPKGADKTKEGIREFLEEFRAAGGTVIEG